MTIRIAVITDIHHGPVSHTKTADWQALPAVRSFVDWASEENVELLLDLGDHISDTSRSADLVHAGEVAREFKRFDGRRCHLLGNHDVVNLTIEDHEALFEQSFSSRVVDLETARLIAWEPGVVFSEATGFLATGDALDWLVDTLVADSRPAIIATHVPVSGQSQIGNHNFEHRPHLATYPDHDRIRAAVEKPVARRSGFLAMSIETR